MTVPEPTSIQPTPSSYTVLPAAASRPAGPVTHGSNLPSASSSGTVHFVVKIFSENYHVYFLSCTCSYGQTNI